MIRSVLSIALAYLLMGTGPPQAPSTGPVTYEASAVRFGILPAFAVAGLVAGAERGRTLDIPVMVWLLKGSNGAITDIIISHAHWDHVGGVDPAVFERFERVADGVVRIK